MDEIKSFELHAMPASRVVAVRQAVRIGHGGTLMIGADNRVYYSNLIQDRIYSHHIRIPDKVLEGLVRLDVITTGQADEYRAAVKAANDALTAHYDLEALERLSRARGVLINEDDPGVRELRKLASLHIDN